MSLPLSTLMNSGLINYILKERLLMWPANPSKKALQNSNGYQNISLLVNIVTNQVTQLNGAASNYSYLLNVPMANCASSTDG